MRGSPQRKTGSIEAHTHESLKSLLRMRHATIDTVMPSLAPPVARAIVSLSDTAAANSAAAEGTQQVQPALPPALASTGSCGGSGGGVPHTVIVGCGPAGLFAALSLARAAVKGTSDSAATHHNGNGAAAAAQSQAQQPRARVTLLERGRAVEDRGKDIGALNLRRILNPESNFCFGEGGAGTWSDGKLSTTIGSNTERVRAVMNALVEFGAPQGILVDSKPHIGTDRLVRVCGLLPLSTLLFTVCALLTRWCHVQHCGVLKRGGRFVCCCAELRSIAVDGATFTNLCRFSKPCALSCSAWGLTFALRPKWLSSFCAIALEEQTAPAAAVETQPLRQSVSMHVQMHRCASA